MRVAHIITRMIVGGAQENTLYNCLDLIDHHGDDVLLITGPSEGPEGSLLDQHQVDRLPTRVLPHLIRNIDPSTDYQGYREVKQAIREFQPDVVHTHSAKAGVLGRLAATSLNVPAVVHTVHGAPFHPFQSMPARRFFIACEWYAARHCHKLISVADAMTQLLTEAGVAQKDKFETVYSGMEVEPFLECQQHRTEMRSKLGLREEHVVVGKIARLFHLKGHEYVIEAASKVAAACPQVRFLLVGDGILRQRWEEQIRGRGLQDHFVFAGLVPPSEIPKYVSAMDVLVHASLREGLARALPQALLGGIPAVSFDIDGAREVVANHETGFLIAPKDSSQLGKRLIQLCQDEKLRTTMGETGKARCREVFSHQVMTRRIRQVYLDVLSSQNRPKA